MLSILLIEDNEMNRDMLSRRLMRAGYNVRMATSGEEGIAIAQSCRPDLILMDLQLPGMNGWQVASYLKSDPATQLIPLIALTAHAMEGDREKAILAGCDDYDVKPIDMPRLLEKIQHLTRRGHDGLSREKPIDPQQRLY
jgi:two-component system cell cycle response regulator DivK